jgi:hypothetical protein
VEAATATATATTTTVALADVDVINSETQAAGRHRGGNLRTSCVRTTQRTAKGSRVLAGVVRRAKRVHSRNGCDPLGSIKLLRRRSGRELGSSWALLQAEAV